MIRRLALLLVLAPAAAHAEPPADALPPGAVARLGDYRFYHGGRVESLVVSTDGRRIVTCGPQRTNEEKKNKWAIHVWDAATGERLPSLSRPVELPWTLALSPDGKTLAAGTLRGITVWDATTMRERPRLPCDGMVTDLTFSHDARHLIATVFKEDVIWFDLETGKAVVRRDPWPKGKPKHADGESAERVSAVTISPDQREIAFTISVIKKVSDQPRVFESVPGPTKFVNCATGNVVREFAPAGAYHLLAYSPDGRTLIAADSHFLRVLNAADGKELYHLQDLAQNPPHRVACSPDGQRFALTGFYGRVEVRDLKTGKIVWQRDSADEFKKSIDPARGSVVAYAPDGKTLLVALNAWPRQIDAGTGIERTHVASHAAPISEVHYTSDGQTVITRAGIRFGAWEFASRRLRRLAEPHKPDVLSTVKTVHAHDGSLLCVMDANNNYVLCDGITGKSLRRLRMNAESAQADMFSPDGHIIAGLASVDTPFFFALAIDFFDVGTGKRLQRLITGDQYSDLTFSQDGTRIAYHTDNFVCVANVRKGVETLRLPRLSRLDAGDPILDCDLVLSADGRTLATNEDVATEGRLSDRRVRVFAVAWGTQIFQLALPSIISMTDQSFSCVALSADGRFVAITNPGETGVRIYETASGLLYHHFDGHRDRVLSAAFAPDGRTLTTGGQDGVALIWDMRFPLRGKARPAADLWADLASADAAKAWAAVHALAKTPDSVRFLRERVKPVRAESPKQVARLIDGLSAPAFADRERAERDLVALRDAARPGLEQALKAVLPAESRKRVQKLLDELRRPVLTGERLRQWRAVAVLERIGTADAAALLDELAAGWSEARLTHDAADARARFAERRPKAAGTCPASRNLR